MTTDEYQQKIKNMKIGLIGKTIKEIIIHDSHGLAFDFILHDGTQLTITSYGSGHTDHYSDEMFVRINDVVVF